MYATSRAGRRRGWARTLCACGSLTQADVVDVVDTVNIAAPEDVSEGRSLTSLTPRFGVNLTAIIERIRLECSGRSEHPHGLGVRTRPAQSKAQKRGGGSRRRLGSRGSGIICEFQRSVFVATDPCGHGGRLKGMTEFPCPTAMRRSRR
jgi:hypothetical protein